jgi:large subunit ribosomal protein L22
MATVEEPRTQVRAEARYVRTAPRKAMLVADQIRGRSVPEARTILAFMTRDAARDVEKVLSSAVANAETNHGLAGDELYVVLATVGSGPTLKRWRARARGRVARIRKRTCHITIALSMPEDETIPAPLAPPPVAVPEPPAEEEEAKPRRAPRKKAEEPAAEEKPATTRKRAAKPRAEKPKAEKPTVEKPKTEKPKAEKPKADAKAKPKPRRTTTPKTTRKTKDEEA